MGRNRSYTQRLSHMTHLNSALEVLEILRVIGTGTRYDMRQKYIQVKREKEYYLPNGVNLLLDRGYIKVIATLESQFVANRNRHMPMVEIYELTDPKSIYIYAEDIGEELAELQDYHEQVSKKRGRAS